MIGLDTNVLIRYITQDDEKQSAIANQFIESTLTAENPGFITLIGLIEIYWVLESCYEIERSKILKLISQLLSTKQLKIEQEEAVYGALQICTDNSSVDFSDSLISAVCQLSGCEKIVTFDKKAQKAGMSLLS